MMIFTSIYSVVDGFFVSNFAGKTAFAAVNFDHADPHDAGRRRLHVRHRRQRAGGQDGMGEGDRWTANQIFFHADACLTLGLRSGARRFWASSSCRADRPGCWGQRAKCWRNCVLYGRIILLAFNAAFMLQNVVSELLYHGGKAASSACTVTVAAGVTNMVLDALFSWACCAGASWARRRPLR